MADRHAQPTADRSSVPSDLSAVLSVRRRRTLLWCLAEWPAATIGFDALVAAVVRCEGGPEHRRDWAPHHQRVAISLHHDDLPRLTEAGLVEYDPWRGEIRRMPDDRLDGWPVRTVPSDDDCDGHDYRSSPI